MRKLLQSITNGKKIIESNSYKTSIFVKYLNINQDIHKKTNQLFIFLQNFFSNIKDT